MPGPARDPARILWHALLWTALGGWLGALLLCGAVVVRAAFEVLPDPALAGQLVGRVLGPLQLAGIGLGVLLATLGGTLGRGRLAMLLPLALAAFCAANHFLVAPAVAAIDVADPAAGPDAGARFARLHQLSVALYMATAFGAVLLAALHLTSELREEARKKARIS